MDFIITMDYYLGLFITMDYCVMDQKNILFLDGNKTEFPSTTLRAVPVIW